jgi:hypothetical protein
MDTFPLHDKSDIITVPVKDATPVKVGLARGALVLICACILEVVPSKNWNSASDTEPSAILVAGIRASSCEGVIFPTSADAKYPEQFVKAALFNLGVDME